MSDSTKSSEDGISARISDGDVGKFAGNNIASSRSGIRATDEVVAEETTKPSNTYFRTFGILYAQEGAKSESGNLLAGGFRRVGGT